MISVTISGRVGQDAKELESGCVFSIASTKRGFTTKNGTVVPDKTIWMKVFAHKNLAPHIKKGDYISVYTDFLNTEIYESKVNLSCNALNIEFGPKQESNSEPSEKLTQTQQNQPASDLPPDKTDDLPF